MSCFLAETTLGFSLVTHRVVYTLLPFKAERILTPSVLKIHLLAQAVFFIMLVSFMCTPLAGVMFCPVNLRRYYFNAKGTLVIIWMNKVCNYLVGISTVTAYTIVIGVLFFRGNITLRSSAEHRMMTQVAVMSTIGVFYAIYWEFGSLLHIGQTAATTVYENLTLFYYDAVMLPYLLLNTTFREEFLKTFRRKKKTAAVICVPMLEGSVRKPSVSPDGRQ